jgi:AP-3 complex subunit delta-1
VPLPADLDLDEPIHNNLACLLSRADAIMLEPDEPDEFETYYSQKPAPTSISSGPAIERLGGGGSHETVMSSYQQQADESSYMDAEVLARRRAERIERNRDDPFYIPPADDAPQTTSTPIHNILQTSNGSDLDIDNIPIMKLDLGSIAATQPGTAASQPSSRTGSNNKARQKIIVSADETLDITSDGGTATPSRHIQDLSETSSDSQARPRRPKHGGSSLLQISAGRLASLSLEASDDHVSGGFVEDEQAEMARAVKEVERLRLEMQRANERIHVAQGVVPELVRSKRKKKKKTKKASSMLDDGKKSVKKADGGEEEEGSKRMTADDDGGGGGGASGHVVETKEKEKEEKKKKKTRIAEIMDLADT